MSQWQLQKAKAKLSEVIKKRVVSFIKFIRKSPLVGVKLNTKRDKSLTREDIDL